MWSPEFAQGLNLALDWWNIRIEGTMVADTPNAILSDCYVAKIESRCAMFRRDPNLKIVNDLTFGLRNAGFTETEGYDLSVSYRFKTNAGDFSANWETTYISKYDYKATNDAAAPIQPQIGFWDTSIGAVFRTRSNLDLGWTNGVIGLNWGMRYFSSMKEECYFETECNIPNYRAPWTQGSVLPLNRTGSTTFNDVQFFVKTPWKGTVALGANNVFNRFGAVAYSQPSSNFAYYGGFDIGRFVYMKYSQTF